jgi:hypothetical protein
MGEFLGVVRRGGGRRQCRRRNRRGVHNNGSISVNSPERRPVFSARYGGTPCQRRPSQHGRPNDVSLFVHAELPSPMVASAEVLGARRSVPVALQDCAKRPQHEAANEGDPAQQQQPSFSPPCALKRPRCRRRRIQHERHHG